MGDAMPDTTTLSRRTVLTALAAAPFVAAGMSAARAEAGATAWTSGLNSSGQLGSGTLVNRPTFAAAAVLLDADQAAGGREHVLATTSSASSAMAPSWHGAPRPQFPASPTWWRSVRAGI